MQVLFRHTIIPCQLIGCCPRMFILMPRPTDGFCVRDVKPCRGAALDDDLTNLTEKVYPNATPNPNAQLNPSEPGVAYPTGSKLRAENGGQNQKSFAECRAPTPNQPELSENQDHCMSRIRVFSTQRSPRFPLK